MIPFLDATTELSRAALVLTEVYPQHLTPAEVRLLLDVRALAHELQAYRVPTIPGPDPLR